MKVPPRQLSILITLCVHSVLIRSEIQQTEVNIKTCTKNSCMHDDEPLVKHEQTKYKEDENLITDHTQETLVETQDDTGETEFESSDTSEIEDESSDTSETEFESSDTSETEFESSDTSEIEDESSDTSETEDESSDDDTEPREDDDEYLESEVPMTKSEDDTTGTYEFPVLSRVEPGTVGDVVEVGLEEGVKYKRITRAVKPPIFEIPNFLSDEECDLIIESAKKAGLNISNLFGEDINEQFDDETPLANISRVSEQTWLDATNLDNAFFDRLQHRVARLTELPVSLIKRAESIQVVSYAPGGHYHAHLDTVDSGYELPCCFQTNCKDKELTPQWSECCRLCRFITVLYYLNDPEEGGETAFPIADKPDNYVEQKLLNADDEDWHNLSYYCYNSSLVVKPKRGTAVMWYNHFVDKKTGYLGMADRRSYHGGCDLKKGTKWIANTWISGTTPEDRFKPSIFYRDTA